VGEQLAQLPPREAAQALTLACVRLFHRIEPDEFVVYMWGSKEQKADGELFRNLTRFVERFNRMGYWVATEVVAQTDVRARALVLEHYIRVAKVPRTRLVDGVCMQCA
jgi:hypothetical protein